MSRVTLSFVSFPVLAFVLSACTGSSSSVDTVLIEPGPEAQEALLRAFIEAQPGDVIELASGRFELDTTLSLDASGVTVRGQGKEETTLDFQKQLPGSGGEGLSVTADQFVIEDLGVVNTRGDGIKVEGTTGVTFRNVRVVWERGPHPENGAYGIYPVLCSDVLIEDSEVRGASDAGIYVGQSQNIIVRRNLARENVAGIEIENSTGADVYDNVSYGNTGGLLVFSLPELPVKTGRDSRVFNNEIYDNNHPNFGKEGNIIASLPPGTGMIVMANDNTEVFENSFRDHQTVGLSILSFLSTGRTFDDPEYDPYPEGIWVHDNTFEGGGGDPQGDLAATIAPFVGTPLPDIVYDGLVDERKLEEGQLPPALRVYVENNGEARFANFDMASLLNGGEPRIETDVALYAGTLPAPPPPIALAAAGG